MIYKKGLILATPDSTLHVIKPIADLGGEPGVEVIEVFDNLTVQIIPIHISWIQKQGFNEVIDKEEKSELRRDAVRVCFEGTTNPMG